MALPTHAQTPTFTTVYSFVATGTTGGGAYAGLRLSGDGDGLLYGTLSNADSFGQIFTIGLDGTGFSPLGSLSASTGSSPLGTVLELPSTGGQLFTTMHGGGTSSKGSIVRVNRDGTGLVNLHSFAGGTSDGAQPFDGLLLASDGKLYGTLDSAGASNGGGVFSINTNGTGYSLIHSFASGSGPTCALIETAGTLYGTSAFGGAHSNGFIFSTAHSGATATLHDFTTPDGSGHNTDGSTPYAGLLAASDGYLYGLTENGGANGKGVIFRIATSGGATFQKLHDFTGADGSQPLYGPLIQGADGRIYGVTSGGGANGDGAIFRIDLGGGNYQLLHSFITSEGSLPYGALVETSTGTFYGTTQTGGANGKGTIYKLVFPSAPPASTGVLTLKPKKKRIVTTRSRYTIRGTATDTSGTTPRVFVQTGSTQGKKAKGSFNWRFRTRVLPFGRTRFNVYADDPANLSSITYHVTIIRR